MWCQQENINVDAIHLVKQTMEEIYENNIDLEISFPPNKTQEINIKAVIKIKMT